MEGYNALGFVMDATDKKLYIGIKTLVLPRQQIRLVTLFGKSLESFLMRYVLLPNSQTLVGATIPTMEMEEEG